MAQLSDSTMNIDVIATGNMVNRLAPNTIVDITGYISLKTGRKINGELEVTPILHITNVNNA